MTHIIRPVALVGAIVLGSPLLGPHPILGQSPGQPTPRITLEEAIAMFERNSLELRLARSEAAEVQALARQAVAYPNPTLSGSHEPLSEENRTYSESYLNVSQRLEWPGTRSAVRAAASATGTAALARLSADSARFAFQVKEAYTQAAGAERAEAVLVRVTELFREGARRALERHEEGDISLYDRRRIRVERIRYETRLAEAALEASSARRRLALLIAPEGEATEIAPVDFLASLPPVVSAERAVTTALERRRVVAAAEADFASAQAAAAAARRRRLPDVTATAGYKSQSEGLTGAFLGLSIPVPVWDRRGGAIEGADAGARAAEERVALIRRQVENDVARAWEAYSSFAERTELLGEGDVDEPGDLLEIARVAYEEGEVELLDLLDAAEALTEARLAEVRFRTRFWISYYDLERAVGGLDASANEGEAHR